MKINNSTISPLIQTLVITGLLLSRLVPHPPNFTPVFAAALFSGTYFYSKKWAYLFPLFIVISSDLIINYITNESLIIRANLVTYFCVLLTSFMGSLMRSGTTPIKVIFYSTLSSVCFFIISNFFVWYSGNLYPHNIGGITACYVAALPFFKNTLLSGAVYSSVFYTSYFYITNYFHIPKKQ
ncbi:DUF6580 family putative transport protein [Ichthyobacterium seriolicida]|uniref:Rod shape-determining protein MreD n=1 Tax=Ichthyobacterium seriolicida TaxID=242600 RepID=A0A1J1DZS2_9FLAO|nr:DUF6580 family putative transport protein [Ichthyobacterium seriolicida]BAV95426.1 hypothetical protein JBKA6_1413 [Ichthyobacterium seriolicida]